MRYLRQRDSFRCSAVAVCNAMKWRGQRVTYADAVRLCKRWHVTRERLANCATIQRHLRIRGRVLDEPSVRKIIAAGHAVIVSSIEFAGGVLWGHAWFCPGFVEYEGKPAGYIGINVFEGETQSAMSWSDMQRLVQLGYVWTIKR